MSWKISKLTCINSFSGTLLVNYILTIRFQVDQQYMVTTYEFLEGKKVSFFVTFGLDGKVKIVRVIKRFIRKMTDSDDSSDEYIDAAECVPQKETHFDVSDARKNIEPPNVTEISVKDKNAFVIKQDLFGFEYDMNHTHRGVAIIFNHYEYNDSSLEKRVGTDKDVEALIKTLPLIGFLPENIIIEQDLSKSEIFSYSYKVSATHSEIFKDCDCIAIFILSHGSKDNKLYARDGDYDLYRLIDQYTPNNMKGLAAKPKLFFINACRGDNKDDGIQLRRMPARGNYVTDAADNVAEQKASHPVHADILISMSSHHEHISFRNINGSWYIQDLCNAIKYYHDGDKLETTDITEVLLYTHFLVAQRESSSDDRNFSEKKQIPNYNSALCRKLYFKKKL